MLSFEPIIIKESVVKNQEVFGDQTPILESQPIVRIGVPQIDLKLGHYGFVQIRGSCRASVQSVVGSNSPLKLAVNLPTAFKGTTALDQRVGITTGQSLSGVNIIPILLLGNKVAIPAT